MEIASKLTETAYVASRTGTLDATGKPTYDTPRAVACRAERTTGVTKGNANADTTTFTMITTEEILPTDRVWLPGVATSAEDAEGHPESAREPGANGVQPAVRLRGSSTLFFQTVL